MSEQPEIPDMGPLNFRRRGVAPGRVLLWMLISAGAGAIGWGIFGNIVRVALNLPPTGAPHWTTASTPVGQGGSTGEILSLVKDLQATQQRTADDVRTALQLLTAEQGTTKALSDAVAVLQSKVDALQQRPVVPVAVPAAKRASVPTPARRPGLPQQIAPSTEPAQSEPDAEGAVAPR